MSVWTYAWPNSIDETFEFMGIEECIITYRVADADEMTLTFDSPYDYAAYPHNQEAIIKKDGVTVFRGYLRKVTRVGSGTKQRLIHLYKNAWDFWELTPYTSAEKYIVPNTINWAVNRTVPGVVFDGSQTASQIIATCANVVSTAALAGTIDYYGFRVPSANLDSVSLADVLRYIFRFTPTVYTWFDYTQNPPRFNVKIPSSATPSVYTLPESRIESIGVARRFDLQVGGVNLAYDTNATINDYRTGEQYDGRIRVQDTAFPTGSAVGTTNIVARRHNLGTRHNLAIARVNLAPYKIGEFLKDGSPPSYASGRGNYFVDFWNRNGWNVQSNMAVAETTLEFKRYLSELGGTPIPVSGQAWLIDDIPRELYYTSENPGGYVVSEISVKQRVNDTYLRGTLYAVRKAAGDITPLGTSVQTAMVPSTLPTPPTGVAFAMHLARQAEIYEGTVTSADKEIDPAAQGRNRLDLSIGSCYGIQTLEFNVRTGRMTWTLGPGDQLGPQDFISLMRPKKPD